MKRAVMLPYVILHMGISLDSRMDWGIGSDNPYYELVEQFGADTDISGSNTILQATFPENPQEVFGEAYNEWMKKPGRPMHAIVDSKEKKTKAYDMYIPVTGQTAVSESCNIPNQILPNKGTLKGAS